MAVIREVVCHHHGGFGQAEDAQIQRLWDSLTEETRLRYLATASDRIHHEEHEEHEPVEMTGEEQANLKVAQARRAEGMEEGNQA
ncbi:MAG: hypothetical protein KAY37_01030 [Phycisphaerae bacterium]|nr:hypothetical protein [Phycisphaerae bacterium]